MDVVIDTRTPVITEREVKEGQKVCYWAKISLGCKAFCELH